MANLTSNPQSMPDQIYPDPDNDNQCSCSKVWALSAEIERLRGALESIYTRGTPMSVEWEIAKAARKGFPVETKAPRESDWNCVHCGRDNDPSETHCVQCEWSRKHTIAGVLHERGCFNHPCICDARKVAAPRETSAPQAPIVWVVVADNGGISASGSYAPGLPPGNHDLYCVPEAVAPMMRAVEPAEEHEDKADLLSMAALVARIGRDQAYSVPADLLKRASAVLVALAETRVTRRHRGCGSDCTLPAGHLGDHMPPENGGR